MGVSKALAVPLIHPRNGIQYKISHNFTGKLGVVVVHVLVLLVGFLCLYLMSLGSPSPNSEIHCIYNVYKYYIMHHVTYIITAHIPVITHDVLWGKPE